MGQNLLPRRHDLMHINNTKPALYKANDVQCSYVPIDALLTT